MIKLLDRGTPHEVTLCLRYLFLRRVVTVRCGLVVYCGVLFCLALSKYDLTIPARALELLNRLYLALCCVSLVMVPCSVVPF